MHATIARNQSPTRADAEPKMPGPSPKRAQTAQTGRPYRAFLRGWAFRPILGDMLRQVGGDRVEVITLVGPNGDAHVYQPTPADAKRLREAKVLVINGLGFEGWISRLEQSSGFKGLVVTASKGVKAQQMTEEEGGKAKRITDPHAWQSLANGRIYAENIRDGLIQADPDGKAAYEANAAQFIAA